MPRTSATQRTENFPDERLARERLPMIACILFLETKFALLRLADFRLPVPADDVLWWDISQVENHRYQGAGRPVYRFSHSK